MPASTTNTGVNTQKKVTINQDFHFDAAHHLPGYNGKCRNVHGHRWELQVSFDAFIGEDGMSEDFGVLKNVIDYQVIDELDHRDLNDVIPNPTAENLCVWIWDRIQAVKGNYLRDTTKLSFICLWEAPSSSIEYRGGIT